MINLYLTRGECEHRACLRLPATPDKIGEVFAWLDETGAGEPTRIVDVTSKIPNLYRYIRSADVDNGDNLNLLQQIAEKTDGLSKQQAQTLTGALDSESINGLEDILSTIERLDKYTFIPNVTCDKELGGYLVETGYLDVPERLLPYLSYPGIGAEYYAEHGGAYTKDGYVLRKSALEPYLEPYHDAIFHVHLHSQQTREPYILTLPAPLEQMALAERRLGVSHISDAEIAEVKCTAPYLGNLIPLRDADIRELDELAVFIADMKSTDGELLKFCLVLEAEWPESVEEAMMLAFNLDDYEQVTDNAREYGQDVLKRLGADQELLDAIEGYMDFERLGQDAMREDGVRRTEFGLVRRLSEPFPEQGYEQKIGGM